MFGLRLTHVFVTGSDNGHDTSLVEVLNGLVNSLGQSTAKRHVHDSLALDAALLDVVDDELHAVENIGVLAAAVGIEDLDSNKVDLFGNTKLGASNGTSNVAAVAVLIGVLAYLLVCVFDQCGQVVLRIDLQSYLQSWRRILRDPQNLRESCGYRYQQHKQ